MPTDDEYGVTRPDQDNLSRKSIAFGNMKTPMRDPLEEARLLSQTINMQIELND